MDLPLAASEPSTALCAQPSVRFARCFSVAQNLRHPLPDPFLPPTGPRLQFARRAHQQRIHPECFDKPHARHCQEKNSLCANKFALKVTRAPISSSRTPCRPAPCLASGIPRDTKPGNSSQCSPALKISKLSRRDQLPPLALPTRQMSRSASRP